MSLSQMLWQPQNLLMNESISMEAESVILQGVVLLNVIMPDVVAAAKHLNE